MKPLIIIIAFLYSPLLHATDFYVTNDGGGTTNGSSLANAFAGWNDIDWDTDGAGADTGVGASDTLYVHGTVRSITFPTSGYGLSEAERMVVTSSPSLAGGLFQGWEVDDTGWTGPDAYGAYYKSANVTNHDKTAVEWTTDPWDSNDLTIMSGVPDSTWSGNGLFYVDTENELVYYKPVTGTPTGKTLTAFATTGDTISVSDKPYVTLSGLRFNNRVAAKNGSDYFILEDSEIYCPNSATAVLIGNNYTLGSHYGIIRNNYIHDCGNGIYFINQASDSGDENNCNYWLVESNRIEDIYGTSDSHGIGVQGGTGNVFTKNQIYNVGTGITFWNYQAQLQNNNVVSYNKIDHLGYYNDIDTSNGRGIEFSGETEDSNNTTGNLIIGNTVSDCYRDADNDPDGLGIRIKMGQPTNGYSVKAVNNIVTNCYNNYYIKATDYEDGEIGAYLEGNASLFPNGNHIYLTSLADTDLNSSRNTFYPDGTFYAAGSQANLAAWQIATGQDLDSAIGEGSMTILGNDGATTLGNAGSTSID